MMFDEQAVLFGDDQRLVGIVTRPAASVATRRLGAVFINAGVVHRVGPNRIYVTAARELAACGVTSARFDLSGIGDSTASLETIPFEQAAVAETQEVMSRLQTTLGIDRFVLLGICSGAVVSFKTALADERVAAAVLINPQGLGGNAQWNAYVRDKGRARRLASRVVAVGSWRRALSGRTDYQRVCAVALSQLRWWRGRDAAIAGAGRQLAEEFRNLGARGVRLLVACSQDDDALDYMREILGPDLRAFDSRYLSMQMLPAGDHSLTMNTTQQIFLSAVHTWAGSLPEGAV